MEWDHISLTVMDYYLSLVQMAIPGIISADRGSKNGILIYFDIRIDTIHLKGEIS